MLALHGRQFDLIVSGLRRYGEDAAALDAIHSVQVETLPEFIAGTRRQPYPHAARRSDTGLVRHGAVLGPRVAWPARIHSPSQAAGSEVIASDGVEVAIEHHKPESRAPPGFGCTTVFASQQRDRARSGNDVGRRR